LGKSAQSYVSEMVSDLYLYVFGMDWFDILDINLCRCGEWKTKECGVSGMVCSMRIQY